MKDFLPIIKSSPLFNGINDENIKSILNCLNGTMREYAKGEHLFHVGDSAQITGLIIQGTVHIMKEDYWGNSNLQSSISAPNIFGQAYAASGLEKLEVGVVAATDCTIMLLNINNILHKCPKNCQFHNQLENNLLRILASNAVALVNKIQHLSKRTSRAKLLSYLSDQSALAGSLSFDIPFNRQELADYLSIDRSAMSAELSRMQKESLIRYKKNHFQLL